MSAYYSWRQFLDCVRKRGFLGIADYSVRCVDDPRLPPAPHGYYPKNLWDNEGGWKGVLGTQKYSWEEFLEYVKKHGITNGTQYIRHFLVNKRLHTTPCVYPQFIENGGWIAIARQWFYSFPEFVKRVKELGIQTRREYLACYHLDSRLCKFPWNFYEELKDAGSWRKALGLPKRWEIRKNPERNKIKFYSWREFVKKFRKYGFKDEKDYLSRYKIDQRLPGNPWIMYRSEWGVCGGWKFLTQSPDVYTWDEFLVKIRSLGIKTSTEYSAKKDLDPRFPKSPAKVYAKEMKAIGGWKGVFNRNYLPWKDIVSIVKEKKIKCQREYLAIYKLYPGLPSTPHKIYPEEWVACGSSFQGILTSHP
jgi:hypothetical protein